MGPKLCPLICVLIVLTMISVSCVQSDCVVPTDVIKTITADQLSGTWFNQIYSRRSMTKYVCDIADYDFKNATNGLLTRSSYIGERGSEEWVLLHRGVTIMNNGTVLLKPEKAPPSDIFVHFLVMKKYGFVATICETDKGKFIRQYDAVLTRSRVTEKKDTIYLLSLAGINRRQFFFMENPPLCSERKN